MAASGQTRTEQMFSGVGPHFRVGPGAAIQQPPTDSDLGRGTPAHADTRLNLVPGFLIAPNDGRVGLGDLQIDLDAAESRQTPFSFCKERLSNPFVPMGFQNGNAGNPPSMSFVSSHHRAYN